MRFEHRILTYCQGEAGSERLMWYVSDAGRRMEPAAEYWDLRSVLAEYGEDGWEVVDSHAVPAASNGQPLLYCVILKKHLG